MHSNSKAKVEMPEVEIEESRGYLETSGGW